MAEQAAGTALVPAAAGAVAPEPAPDALGGRPGLRPPGALARHPARLRQPPARLGGVVPGEGRGPCPGRPGPGRQPSRRARRPRAYVTLTSRLSAIAQAHHLLAPALRPARSRTAENPAGHRPRPRHKAQAAGRAAAHRRFIKLAGICGGDLRGERDRALILLGFAGAFRRAELVEIRVGDLTFGPHGLSVFLPRSKADQIGEGSLVHVAANPLAAHCPVAAVRAWLDAAGIRQGWVFRRITRSDAIGRQGLSAESVRLILKERAWEAGYRGAALDRITPHSLRAGCITTLAQASVHERDIMQHSRHGSQAVMRSYIRAAAIEEAFTSGALWRREDRHHPELRKC